MSEGPVPHELVGEVLSPALPSEDRSAYGSVTMSPTGPFEVRSFQTLTFVYTVGRYGLDDTGSIRIVSRHTGDMGQPQTSDPKARNYVTATSSGNVNLVLDYRTRGAHVRPRQQALTIHVSGGYLREGDTITVVMGDTSGGSPGLQMQTFVESGTEFMVLADVIATGHYALLSMTPSIAIVPGPPARWKAVLSSLRRPGETFRLGLKAEDIWGNPTPQASGRLRFETTMPVDGLPETYDYAAGQRAVSFDGLSVAEEGVLRVRVLDEAGTCVAESHPLVIRQAGYGGFWGDLHGQSGETVGIGNAREYFQFAREYAFLDATSHQGNDFQINKAFWAHLNDLTAEFHQDGRCVVFPGYEWSGNTAVGGDHNVFFRNEGRLIYRSSHALLTDRSDIDTDAPNLKALYEALADEDSVVYAHVGGRYADISYAHDPRVETSMEIHSAWGTFEWLLTDGFELGHRSGVVCNSDGHKGRPGASFPGAAKFGAYGGLTCFYADELTRDGIFAAARARHTFGTTGTRLHLAVHAAFKTDGQLYDRNPKAFDDATTTTVGEVMMGDIAHTDDTSITLRVEAITQSPIERIEIRNGKETVKVLRGYEAGDLGQRIRVVWSGAEYRGRGRTTTWTGQARMTGARINRIEKINAWNPERPIDLTNDTTVDFNTITTGNFGGFDAWLADETGDGSIEIETNHGTFTAALADVGMDDQVMEAGGLERRLRVFRLPETMQKRELTADIEVPLKPTGDNPLWVCVTTEDGHQAWSSPIFLYNAVA